MAFSTREMATTESAARSILSLLAATLHVYLGVEA